MIVPRLFFWLMKLMISAPLWHANDQISNWEDAMFDWPLTPPKQVTLLLSLILAISACLVHWLHIAVPPLGSGFVLLVLGYVVLLAGNVFRDI